MTRRVQRSYKYRWYPTDEQAAELARTFGWAASRGVVELRASS
jgi:hypothetical protein